MGRAVFCTAATEQEAYRFVGQLRIAGLPAEDISMLHPDASRPHLVHARRSKAAEGALAGALAGALLAGLAAGLAAAGAGPLALPALAATAGTVLAVLAAAALGGAVGAAAGAVAGARVPKYELRALRAPGGRAILISVHVADRALAARAGRALRAAGAHDVALVREARARRAP